MKKFLKWFFIVIAVLVVLILAAAIALPFVLPLDRIKDFAAQKMSETLHRNVKIGKVSFNIFTGIGIDNLYIGNRKGFADKPFLSASKIDLKYDLWSLFSGRFKVNKVALISPKILIEKKGQQFNFSDLIPAPAAKEEKKVAPKKEAGKPPVLIDVSTIIIRDAALTYLEYTKAGVEKSGFDNLDLTVSGITLDLSKPINLVSSATVIYQGKPVPVSLSFLANVNLAKEKAKVSNLKLGAAGDTLAANVSVNGFTKNQDINFDFSSGRINLDKFMAILSGKPAPKEQAPSRPSPHGALTRSINDLAAGIPAGMKVNGDISLKNITFKEMTMDSFNVNVNLADKVLKITSKDTEAYKGNLNSNISVNFKKPGLAYAAQEFDLAGFNAAPFANAVVDSFLTNMKDYLGFKDKISGTLNLNAKIEGAGVETPELLKNAKGTFFFALKDGMLKKIASLSSIGEKIGLAMFKKDMEIKILKGDASLLNGVLKVKTLHMDNGEAGDAVVDFAGSLDLVKQQYVSGNTVTLRLSPRVAPKELDAFKDSNGWAVVEFELTGSLSKPIPIPKFGKVLENVVKHEVTKSINAAVSKEVSKQEQQLQKEVEKGLKNLFNIK